MKILLASSSGIYDENFPETRKNVSGFGHMIRALSDMLTQNGDHVDVITQSNMTKGRSIGKASLLKKTWISLIVHFNPFYLVKMFSVIIHNPQLGFGTALRTVLYYLTGGLCEYYIRKNQYDVVHVNGIGNSAIPLLYACARTGVPVVVTLHGLYSFSEYTKADDYSKRIEREFCRLCCENNAIMCTVVSSGVKKRMIEFADCENADNIAVILNPIILNGIECRSEKLSDDKYNIVCIGNISAIKNQKMLVDAFPQISRDIIPNARIYFLGAKEASLKEYAGSISDDLIFTGSISRERVHAFLESADLNVLASVDEGFGLSIVEGYFHGVPAVIPKGIDAYSDIFADNVAISVDEYTNESFAKAIERAYQKKWDKSEIRSFSERFSQDNCADRYLSELKNAFYNKNILAMDTVNKLFMPRISICDEEQNGKHR